MEEVVVGAGTWLEHRHQVNLLDAEFVRGASRTRVEERHQARQHLTRVVDRDRLSPRLPDSPVPHHRRFFLRAAFVKPRLTNDDDAIGMRLCSFYRAAKVPFEMVQHWRRVGHVRASLDAVIELKGLEFPHGDAAHELAEAILTERQEYVR